MNGMKLSVVVLVIMMLAVVAAAIAQQQEPPTIASSLQAMRTALAAKEYETVFKQAHQIATLAAAQKPEALTGPDHIALATAYYYLTAEELHKALAIGGLTEEQQKLAQTQRDKILGIKPAAPEAGQFKPGEVQVIGQGQLTDIKQYLVPEKTTIFDFYSEGCPPCRALSPKLEALAKKRLDLAIIKVDINRPGATGIDWMSPLARQYKLESIPHLKVFNPDGSLKAEGEAAFRFIEPLL